MAKIGGLGDDATFIGDLGDGVNIDDLGGGVNLGDLDSPATPLAIADMVNITSKQVYTVLTDTALSGVANDGDVDTAIEALVVNSEVNDYDWSCMSIAHLEDAGPEAGYSNSRPIVMISDTHGLCAHHNTPAIPDGHLWFRTPAGASVKVDVEANTTLTESGATLVRLASNPGATIYRCPIVNDRSLQRYVAAGGQFWQFYQTLSIRLRECSGFALRQSSLDNAYLECFNHVDSDWSQGPVTAGSGRPAFVPLNDGTLLLIGTVEFGVSDPGGNDRISLDKQEIIDELAAHGEEATFMDLPGYASFGSLAGSVGFSPIGRNAADPLDVAVLQLMGLAR